MEFLYAVFDAIGDSTWGWSLIPFLVVLGVFFTLASGFVQFQFFGRMFRVLFPGGQDGGRDTSAPVRPCWSASAGGSAAATSLVWRLRSRWVGLERSFGCGRSP
jgi:AGCS family alanine or glycine:cation symporter